MSRRVLVAQQPSSLGVIVPVALTRDARGGFTFAIELGAPIAPEIVIDAAQSPSPVAATERGCAVVSTRTPNDLVRLSIGNAKGEWLATRALPPLEPVEVDSPLEPRGWIELQRARERLVMCLPAWRPRLAFEDHEAELRCEAAHLDLDAQRVRLDYRARAELGSESAVLLSFGEQAHPSHLSFALEAGVEDEPPDPAELAAARLSLPYDTALPFPVYVRAAAELMEPSVDRARVLEALALTEDQWLAEESAWLERMGTEAMHGDPSLALAYGELLTGERVRRAKADEQRSLEDYARIRVELERLGDPERVLEAHGLSLAGWFRLDAHWESQLEIAPRLEELLADEHARLDRREREEEPA